MLNNIELNELTFKKVTLLFFSNWYPKLNRKRDERKEESRGEREREEREREREIGSTI
jgi:hypothetical protein